MNANYIGDIAAKLNVSQRTIRYYEELGLLKPTRTTGGFRLYADAEVERLKTILMLKELGMTLEEIRTLIEIRHQDIPSQATPKLREMLLNRRAYFESMINKYRIGLEQLDRVISLLKICATCGHPAEQAYCKHCLQEHDEEVPPLMQTLL